MRKVIADIEALTHHHTHTDSTHSTILASSCSARHRSTTSGSHFQIVAFSRYDATIFDFVRGVLPALRKLYLPLGGRRFWSRRAYELAYASQRETKYDRALRRARKLRLRLGGDPADDEYPDKPPRMRWATYNRLMDRLVAADGVVDERLRLLGIDAASAGWF
jgi:hypothetical protein